MLKIESTKILAPATIENSSILSKRLIQPAPIVTQNSIQNKYMFVMPPMLTLGYVRPPDMNIRTTNPTVRFVTAPPQQPIINMAPANVAVSPSAFRQTLPMNVYLTANMPTSTNVQASSSTLRLIQPASKIYLTPNTPLTCTNVPTSPSIRFTPSQPAVTTNLHFTPNIPASSTALKYGPSSNKYLNPKTSSTAIRPRIIRTGQPLANPTRGASQLNSKTKLAPPQNFITIPVNTSTGQAQVRFPLITQVKTQDCLTCTPKVPINKPPIYKNPFQYPSLEVPGGVQKSKPEPQSAAQPQTKNVIHNQTKSKDISRTNRWKCLICSEIKDSKDALLDHYEFHKEEKDKLEKAKNTSVDTEYGTNVDFLQCPVCPKQFHVLTTYERHVNIEHGEKQFYCAPCRLSYKNAFALSVHNMNKHATVPEQYTCCVCKTFVTKSEQKLRRHISETHDNGTYKCGVCQKTFTSLTWLRDHKIFHIDTSAFECKICRKKFPRSWELIAHNKRVHESKTGGVTKFECEECNLTFANKKALLRHIRSHSQEAALCFICGKVFEDEQKLKSHMQMHDDVKKYVCNVCGTRFRQRYTLINHLRTHSGEKPHKCITCGKCFSQRTPLVIHQRHHTGERPYICPTCNKGYVSKSALSIHRRSCT